MAAIAYAYEVMSDTSEPTALRLKAADLLLHHGMPRGDVSRYLNEQQIGAITLTFVTPAEVEEERRRALTIDTEPAGNGD